MLTIHGHESRVLLCLCKDDIPCRCTHTRATNTVRRSSQMYFGGDGGAPVPCCAASVRTDNASTTI